MGLYASTGTSFRSIPGFGCLPPALELSSSRSAVAGVQTHPLRLVKKHLCKRDFYVSITSQEVDWVALYSQRKRQLNRLGTIRLSPKDILPGLLKISDDGLGLKCTGPSVGEPFGISFPTPFVSGADPLLKHYPRTGVHALSHVAPP